METGLKDQVVLITGASGGIGQACARAFAAEGARLALVAHKNLATIESLAADLNAEALTLAADLSREADVARVFAATVNRFGRIDVVVANAGAWVAQPQPIHRMSLEHWNRIIAVNQSSVFLCAREFFRILENQRPQSASLIIVSSTSAVFGAEGHAEYAAAKAATAYGLTRSLKNEIVRLAPRGRVNSVSPGWVYTAMSEPVMKHEANVVRALQTRAITEISRPSDIAGTIVFLASDRLAGHITGENFVIAAGMEGRVLHRAEDIRLDG